MPCACDSRFDCACVRHAMASGCCYSSVAVWIIVGFLLVGSVSFINLAITSWTIVQVNCQLLTINNNFVQFVTLLKNKERANYTHVLMQLTSFLRIIDEISNVAVFFNSQLTHHQNIQDSNTRYLASRIDDLYKFSNGQSRNHTINNCSRALVLDPSAKSGYYWIKSSDVNSSAVRTYCGLSDLHRLCGGSGTDVWTRVAFLNMSDPTQTCPSNWSTISFPVRACGSKHGLFCNGVSYPALELTYFRVCGRVIGYQQSSTNDFARLLSSQGYDIDREYLDGVSLTHGPSGARTHIWSFASSNGDGLPARGQNQSFCECNSNRSHPTLFVRDDYFCDSGNHVDRLSGLNTFFSDDPLWDGKGCSSRSSCCRFNTPPWFNRTLPGPTTNDIEVRICRSHFHEDTPIKLLELFVM